MKGNGIMPIYEYKCGKCGAEFERLVKSAETKPSCPECGSAKVEKKLSRFAASVKQSGCPGRGICPEAGAGGCGCGHAGCGHHH